MDINDFDYLQDDALNVWRKLFYSDVVFEDVDSFAAAVQEEFIPRFERDIYHNLASKFVTSGNRAVDSVHEI